MKTNQPLILTARIAEKDLEPFDRLRKAHFPPDRNFLSAHLTMFHRLPGEYRDRIIGQLTHVAARESTFAVEVSGLTHTGAGVAYVISNSSLEEIRATLKKEFISWLGPQDMQSWRPHITIQNKAPKARADILYRDLNATFELHDITVVGLDLWDYLGGPWQHAAFAPFGSIPELD